MISLTELRCRRVIQLVEECWPKCTADIFSSSEEKITFRIRSNGGRYRTGKLSLPAEVTLDRTWLAQTVAESIFS